MDKQKIFKELDNFWYHYKVHVIVGVLIAVVIGYIFLTGHSEKPSALNVVMIGSSSQAEQQNLQRTATKEILGGKSDSVIQMSFWPVEGKLIDTQNGALLQKLVAMISAKDIDVLVMDKQSFTSHIKQKTFLKLDPLKQKLPKDVQYLKAQGINTSQKYSFGIKIGQNRKLKKAGYDTTNKILGIVANTKHQKRSIEFVRWLIQSK